MVSDDMSQAATRRESRALFAIALRLVQARGAGGILRIDSPPRLSIILTKPRPDLHSLTIVKHLDRDIVVLDVLWVIIEAPEIVTWRPGPWCQILKNAATMTPMSILP
jgi:hypothetical protein